MLQSVFFQNKDRIVDDIIWTNNVDVNGMICLYHDGEIENNSDIYLDYVSKKGKELLIGVQNLHPNIEGFKGIVIYNMSSKEVTEILEYDKIRDFLGDGDKDFRGNIQMTEDGRFFYFVYGGKMMVYDAEKDEMEILFEAFCYQYVLNKKETCLYFSADKTLYKYDLLTKTTEFLNDNVYNFAISEDEELVCYENRDEGALYLYQIDSGESEKLLTTNDGYSMGISADKRYVLYIDYKGAIVPSNYKPYIKVFDLETAKSETIYKGKYEDNISVVPW